MTVSAPLRADGASAPLLPFPAGCVRARLVRRMKRFFVTARLEPQPGGPEGPEVLAHTNNTGTMLGLLRPGAPVLLSPALTPGRKLPWTLELIWRARDGNPRPPQPPDDPEAAAAAGFWAGVNTSVPNRMLEAAFRAGRLAWTRGYTVLQRERRRGESRLDACLEGPGLPRMWVECKNVTLVEDDAALFPDAVSTRGLKHLDTLIDIVRHGERGVMFYLVQRPDGRCFAPADPIDPAYAARFREAVRAGVEVHVHAARISVQGIDPGPELPLHPDCGTAL